MVTWTMNDNEKLKRIVKQNLDVRAGDEAFRSLRDTVLAAHGHAKETPSAPAPIGTRRIAMKNPITKLAVAAVIIAAVVLGLFESLDTGSTSGVVWAEVAQKVQASRGVIFRMTKQDTPPPEDGGVDFSMNHYSPTKARLDRYKGGEIVNTMYDNCNTSTVILVDHLHKSYVKDTDAEDMPASFQMADPNSVVQRFLSCEYRELGRKIVDGVLCEGVETTDPAFSGYDDPSESLVARLWVSVETGYPVNYEAEYIRHNSAIRFEIVVDYAAVDPLQRLLDKVEGRIDQQAYGEVVRYRVAIPADRTGTLTEDVAGITQGRGTVRPLSKE